MNARAVLEKAWLRRGLTDSRPAALRVFHGPGEGEGALSAFAIESFADGAWVYEWEGRASRADRDAALDAIREFLKARGYGFAAFLPRPERGSPAEAEALFGLPPAEGLEITEESTGVRALIRFTQTRHPGLFLDHAPLRSWLRENLGGKSVLNTFAYTGSLSVAAGLGGASQVTTLDLSKPTVAWAEANWRLNGLAPERADFIYGDVFDWLPRLRKKNRVFDCVILDPPSFSRGKAGTFSTAKDLPRLHALALELLAPKGTLVTSINSANVSRRQFESEVLKACGAAGRSASVLREIHLPPESFPCERGSEADYLKGWILSVTPA